jgi:hypothetical protein
MSYELAFELQPLALLGEEDDTCHMSWILSFSRLHC